METYTITEAARLVGMAKRKLYQAVRTGRLQASTGPEPGAAMTVTAAALQTAGFPVPSTALAPTPASPPTPARPKATAATPRAAGRASQRKAPTPSQPSPPRPGPEQALIAHLERSLQAAQAREQRLLDMLAQVTKPQSASPVQQRPAAQPAVLAPTAAPRAGTPPPQGSLRQQIVVVLQAHPEGLAPHAVRTLLKADREVRSTMKGMVRSGLLTRLEAGRYVVAAARARA